MIGVDYDGQPGRGAAVCRGIFQTEDAARACAEGRGAKWMGLDGGVRMVASSMPEHDLSLDEPEPITMVTEWGNVEVVE